MLIGANATDVDGDNDATIIDAFLGNLERKDPIAADKDPAADEDLDVDDDPTSIFAAKVFASSLHVLPIALEDKGIAAKDGINMTKATDAKLVIKAPTPLTNTVLMDLTDDSQLLQLEPLAALP
ncbi:hypothetical protein L7F22_042437 [Adiantum nelumboides]|nr:hypothetical protein [Adiantum nelumboides]